MFKRIGKSGKKPPPLFEEEKESTAFFNNTVEEGNCLFLEEDKSKKKIEKEKLDKAIHDFLERFDTKKDKNAFLKKFKRSKRELFKTIRKNKVEWGSEEYYFLVYRFFPRLHKMEKMTPKEIDRITLVNEVEKNIQPISRTSSLLFEFPNVVGDKIVENYRNATNKKPGGKCVDISESRTDAAMKAIKKEGLLDNLPESEIKGLSATEIFTMLWNSNHKHNKWKMIDEFYRGKGAAGALAWAGKGAMKNQEEIWAGELKPGAVLQVWNIESDFEKIKNGESIVSFGHSFNFIEYEMEFGEVVGMKIADQGTGWDDGFVYEETFGFWVAANIY